MRPWAEKFLEAMADGACAKHAAAAAGVTRQAAYLYRKQDDEFAKAWAEAEEEGCDELEREARRRAVEGVPRPIFLDGQQVGVEIQYSDRLLEFLLKGRRREVFGDKTEVTGANGGPIETADITRPSAREVAKALLA